MAQQTRSAATAQRQATKSPRQILPLTVHEDHDARYAWSLTVREERGTPVLEARRPIPYDSTLIYSTADEPATAKRRSRYGLSVESVVERYCDECNASLNPSRLLSIAQLVL
jgi:hypothetical protein